MAIQSIGSMNNRFIGLSTDTKPTDCDAGATFFEFNTGYMFIWNGYAWVPKSYMPETTINYKQVDISTAGAKDVMTATAQDLFIDAVVVHVPDDLSAVEALTSMAVATDDATNIEIMSTAEGAKAKLVGDFYHVYRGPEVTAATKKIILTMDGDAGSGKIADVTVLWRPLVAGGYYLNA